MDAPSTSLGGLQNLAIMNCPARSTKPPKPSPRRRQGDAVRVDHADDNQTKALIEQVRHEQGRLDILVNNACSQYNELTDPGNFWEKPVELIEMMDVGLRSGFVATYHAAPMLVQQRRGLVIFTSSSGGVHYMYGPAYGAHKAGLDKLAADMAVDFKDFNVAALSIWMGGVATERVARIIAREPEKLGHLEQTLETPAFTGHIIRALYNDPNIMEISGLLPKQPLLLSPSRPPWNMRILVYALIPSSPVSSSQTQWRMCPRT